MVKKRTTARDYPRTARLNTLVRDILAREMGRIDDERLEFVVLTSVVVDGDLKRAVAYYDHSRGDESDEEIVEGIRLAASGAWWYGYEAGDQQSDDMWRQRKKIRYAINQFDGTSINGDGTARGNVQP